MVGLIAMMCSYFLLQRQSHPVDSLLRVKGVASIVNLLK